jgi:hypothetical protein
LVRRRPWGETISAVQPPPKMTMHLSAGLVDTVNVFCGQFKAHLGHGADIELLYQRRSHMPSSALACEAEKVTRITRIANSFLIILWCC